MKAVGLDGREVHVQRVVRMREELSPSNVTQGDPTVVVTHPDEEWAAWEQLPPLIQEYMREVMPLDQTTVATLAEWRQAQRLGASEQDFVRYLERLSLAYLNATSDVWPVKPPTLTSVPRYDALRHLP